ncbi:unnamed protein product [Linum trigynum]|uniref:Uncharacterized protein n=1 Tax=Linum trigynum TaxID=586398 RepID=A0AAV2E6Q7_9ROSI
MINRVVPRFLCLVAFLSLQLNTNQTTKRSRVPIRTFTPQSTTTVTKKEQNLTSRDTRVGAKIPLSSAIRVSTNPVKSPRSKGRFRDSFKENNTKLASKDSAKARRRLVNPLDAWMFLSKEEKRDWRKNRDWRFFEISMVGKEERSGMLVVGGRMLPSLTSPPSSTEMPSSPSSLRNLRRFEYGWVKATEDKTME